MIPTLCKELQFDSFASPCRPSKQTNKHLQNRHHAILGQGVTPLFVKNADDIVTMNWVWFIPGTFTLIICIFGVTRSKPPTPPRLYIID